MQQPDDPGVEPGAAEPVRSRWPLIAGIYGSGFSSAVIALTTAFGDPQNSLHSSAQSWAFMLLFASLGGVLAPAAMAWLRNRA